MTTTSWFHRARQLLSAGVPLCEGCEYEDCIRCDECPINSPDDATRNVLIRRHAIAQDRRFAADPVSLTGFGALDGMGEICTTGRGE